MDNPKNLNTTMFSFSFEIQLLLIKIYSVNIIFFFFLNTIKFRNIVILEYKLPCFCLFVMKTILNCVSAVTILPILKRKGQPDAYVIVKQYRPPVQACTLEFPAGLIDGGENPVNSALRELKEETGYVGTFKHISPGEENLKIK